MLQSMGLQSRIRLNDSTELKTTKMTLVRPLMTNMKMTVRGDCAVSACFCAVFPPP